MQDCPGIYRRRAFCFQNSPLPLATLARCSGEVYLPAPELAVLDVVGYLALTHLNPGDRGLPVQPARRLNHHRVLEL